MIEIARVGDFSLSWDATKLPQSERPLRDNSEVAGSGPTVDVVSEFRDREHLADGPRRHFSPFGGDRQDLLEKPAVAGERRRFSS